LRAIVSSVNERVNPPEPEDWAAEIRDAARGEYGYSHIILPLRYESRPNAAPAEAYYRALSRVADIEVLAFRVDQPDWVRHPVFQIRSERNRNQQARNVRRHLGWV
jgi:hypothetical protein